MEKLTELEYGSYVREKYCTSGKFPEVNSFAEKIIPQVLRNYTPKCLKVKDHDISNL